MSYESVFPDVKVGHFVMQIVHNWMQNSISVVTCLLILNVICHMKVSNTC